MKTTSMTLQTKIYIGVGVAAILVIGIFGGAAWSNHKIAKLESAVEDAKREANSSQQSAVRKEIEAAEYRQKTEYLEQQLTEIQTIARKQDDELEKLNINTRGAHADVDRSRRTRSITATADELCAKLAELEHPCEEK